MLKVGFELEITELRLGLPGVTTTTMASENHVGGDKNEKKRMFSETDEREKEKSSNKSPAVGWPPVCSYRRRSIGNEKDCLEASKRLIKISKDGAPYLRKIDVNDYKEYPELVAAIEKLFGCSGLGEALRDADNSEYVPLYEDKDGDWLLVGDVPWTMFVESCKRLRIMKRADAKGLQSKKFFHG